MRIFRLLVLAAAGLAGGALAGCDTSVGAFSQTYRPYSIFGYLDANAARQYVRVEPLQDSTLAGTATFDARVTSQHVETGEVRVWRDTTVRVGFGATAHNATTRAPLQAGETYRFTVERGRDGAVSSAVVRLLPAFPVPEVAGPVRRPVLRVEGVERLGGVRAEVDYERCRPTRGCRRVQQATFHLQDAEETRPGTWRLPVPWAQRVLEGAQGATVGRVYAVRVVVASASADWPAYAAYPPGGRPQDVPLPPASAGTNIDNGTGFLGGAFVHSVDVLGQE